MTILTAEGISVAFSGRAILRDVALPPVAPGRLLGVIGPNAAGKSTLLRCLTGELRAGRVAVDGVAQTECAPIEWRRRVSYMPQTPPQAARLSPVELIISAARALELPLSPRQLDARIEKIFSQLESSDLAFSHLSTLSGGQRQIVGFALALSAAPRLMLLDEPTSALDLRWRLKLLQSLRDFVAEGRAAVAVLHDLDLAAQYCDQLLLLHRGAVLACGPPDAVLTPKAIASAYRVQARIDRGDDGRMLISLLKSLDD